MSGALKLLITTPGQILFDGQIRALRAETLDGAFGIWPGHADYLSILVPSVLHITQETKPMLYCALRDGVLSMREGQHIDIACRDALLGDDLHVLEAEVMQMRAMRLDARRRAQTDDMRLQTKAVRQMIRRAQGTSDADALATLMEGP